MSMARSAAASRRSAPYGRASRTTPRQARKPCSGCRRCSRISSHSAAVAGPTRRVGADALNRPPPQLKIAMAAGFVDIGRQLGDAIVELDEFRASATLGGGCEERPFDGIAIDAGDLRCWMEDIRLLRSFPGRAPPRTKLPLPFPEPCSHICPKPAPASATKAAWPVEECQCGLAETQ